MDAENIKKSKLGLDYSLSEIIGSDSSSRMLSQIKQIQPNYCVLTSKTNRAIPEAIITAIIDISCEPIIRFNLPLGFITDNYEMSSLINAYANWGIQRVILFDQPNLISTWGTEIWLQNDLINRFIDRLLIMSQSLLDTGIIPVFPPLNPSGNYSDLMFLRKCLENLDFRIPSIFDNLELSAYAWTHGHDLSWGSGGEECNPHPMDSGSDEISADHQGFHIYDWYNEICQAVILKPLPLHLLQAGLATNENSVARLENQDVFNEIINIIDGSLSLSDTGVIQLPENVISCNMVLPEGNTQNSESIFKNLQSRNGNYSSDGNATHIAQARESNKKSKLINLYVLLPSYDWGVSDWHFDIIRTFVQNHKPAIGFSLEEAKLSDRVLVINDQYFFSPDQIEELRACNCQVEEINQVGTSVATLLAAR